jgi:hypothetical protein
MYAMLDKGVEREVAAEDRIGRRAMLDIEGKRRRGKISVRPCLETVCAYGTTATATATATATYAAIS